MNFEDIFSSPKDFPAEHWQLGSRLRSELVEGGIALIFCSDYRGAAADIQNTDFDGVRRQLYKLSATEFELPMCDLGDLITGKTEEDTHYILQEIFTACFRKNTVPVLIGGSSSLAYQLFATLNFFKQDINYTQVSNVVSLSADGGGIDDKNFLGKLLSAKHLSLKNYYHLGYQKHLNDSETISLLKDVDFEAVRLSEMMGDVESVEPYFRRADLVTVNCDVVETSAEDFSINPQVNGLNRREVCACMKEAGLSENLKSVGIFNYNPSAKSTVNQQLLAQMIWYLVEGINIRRTHPQEKSFETFWVMDGDRQFAFQRDTFSNLWYFGDSEDQEALIPCSRKEYEEAKRGSLNRRFLK